MKNLSERKPNLSPLQTISSIYQKVTLIVCLCSKLSLLWGKFDDIIQVPQQTLFWEPTLKVFGLLRECHTLSGLVALSCLAKAGIAWSCFQVIFPPVEQERSGYERKTKKCSKRKLAWSSNYFLCQNGTMLRF